MVTRAHLKSREEIGLGLSPAVNVGPIFHRDKFSLCSHCKAGRNFDWDMCSP